MDRQASLEHMQEGAGASDQILPNELQDGLSLASSHLTTDALVLDIVESLRTQLVRSSPSVRHGLEMKHILLLLVKAFHDLCEEMAFEKQQWLQRIQETIGQEGRIPKTVREHTGQVILDKLRAAPWGHVKRPGQHRSDTAHTILATYKAMVEFIKALMAGLEQKAQQGVDLKKFDVEEMQSEDDNEEGEVSTPTARPALPKIIIHPPKPQVESASSSPPSVKAVKAPQLSRRNVKGSGSGNFNHGLFTTWTVAEWVHLLKTFQAHPTELGKIIAQIHNDGYWVPKGRNVKRSTDSVRQQYKKLMGKGTKEQTIGNIPDKIAELEGRKSRVAGDEEDGPDGEQGDELSGEQGDEQSGEQGDDEEE